MTPEEREAFYDAEVAPVLLDLADKCKANGLSFAAVVEWAPGDAGETVSVRESASIKILMAAWAIKARGNADALILAMQKQGREHGHNSVCLHLLDRQPT